MTKIISLIILLFIISKGYAQDYNKFRMSTKQKKQLVSKGYSQLLIIEQFLDKNEEYLEENKTHQKKYGITDLLDPTSHINRLKEVNIKNICFDCYIAEYNTQIKIQDSIVQNIDKNERLLTAKKDSLKKIEQNKINITKGKNIVKTEPIQTSNRKNGYDNFIFSMEMTGSQEMGHRYFTVFCDIDLDFASNRLGLYLQDNGLTYDDNGYKDTGNKITYKFVPTVSSKNEYINITYSYIENKQLLSYVTAVTGTYSPCYQIKNVEIVGTKHLILSLYLNYWGLRNLKIGGYKGNETSYNEHMGDYIAYTPIDNRKAKITITKRDNIEMNYYENFKIE